MSEFRLNLRAYKAFETQGLFPKRNALRNFFADRNIKGRGNCEIARFFARKTVNAAFAEGFIAYLKENPRAIPQGLIAGAGSELAVETLFEAAPKVDLPRRYVHAKIGTDPIFQKEARWVWSELVSAAVSTIFGINRPNDLEETEDAFLDSTNGFQNYERQVNIDLGFASTKKGERLSLDEAFERSRNILNEPEGHLAEYAARLCSINPNFIRYAYSSDKKRVGLSAIFPISDEAYALTVKGERPMYSYADDEILRKGNNLVLASLSEDHEYSGRLGVLKRRIHLMGSMFAHIARLLDDDNLRTVRAISYKIHPTNNQRLKSVGFRPCGKGVGPGGFEHQVLAFDPNEHEGDARKGMTLLSDFVWFVRDKQDRFRS